MGTTHQEDGPRREQADLHSIVQCILISSIPSQALVPALDPKHLVHHALEEVRRERHWAREEEALAQYEAPLGHQQRGRNRALSG